MATDNSTAGIQKCCSGLEPVLYFAEKRLQNIELGLNLLVKGFLCSG
jgi:hypothetical protein